MGKITYADEIDARFGVPWTDDFKYVKCDNFGVTDQQEAPKDYYQH